VYSGHVMVIVLFFVFVVVIFIIQ